MTISAHPTALVDPKARLGEDVTIGPYCCIGPDVELGNGVQLIAHVVVAGRTKIGEKTQVYPYASLGHPPQDMKYKGEPSELIIGSHNIIREHVTMNPGTEAGGMVTRVGSHCLFMIATHVAHDCKVDDHVVMANNATLGGHVKVGEYAIIGGLSAVHQYVRIGKHVMVGGMSGVENDIIPYGSVMGNRAHLSGLNIIGLKRRSFSRDAIHTLRNAYRLLFAEEGTMAERLADVSTLFKDHEAVQDIVNFIKADSSRSICQPKAGHAE
ncbi:MAG: acyl-ACP--UDP-N-acetylglucosamine O-acyltransferase [Pseudomonadota bacterium]